MQSATKLRKVIVTGANKGIGYEIAKLLFADANPYHIVLCSRDRKRGEDALQKIKESVSNSNNKIEFQQLEVNDPTSIDNFVNWAKESLKEVDVLVNNAGYGYRKRGFDEAMLTLNTNFFNVVSLTEKILPFLAPDGKVIQVSSGAGLLKEQGDAIQGIMNNENITKDDLMKIANQLVEAVKENKYTELGWNESNYHNSKCLLNTYTRRILSRELSGNQQCYTCTPGYCRTDMTSPDAPLSAEEGAGSTMFLIKLPFVRDDNFNTKFIRKDFVVPY